MSILLNYKNLFKKYGIKPLKKFGQNFLIDKTVLKKTIDAATLSPKDTVLEIGPGLGILTIELAKRVKKVIAVEKDGTLCQVLKDILKDYKNIEIINKDILKIENCKLKISKLVANLPYYIASPVIRKFLEAKHGPELMVLMVQKEVAQRICAKPGKMSILAISVQFYAKAKIISYVSKKSFWPQPKVDSAILWITPRKNTDSYAEKRGINTKQFFNLVRIGFSSKRKMLKNNLKIEKSILKKLGLNPKTRAESLSVQDWLNLYEEIYKK